MSDPSAVPGEWPAVFQSLVAEVLATGDLTEAGSSLSVGAERSSREVLNHSFAVANPLNRVLAVPGRPFNLAAAIGRFVWMMTGSNRLEEIAFYDTRARRFSDDGHTVPGSADGARLLNPRPGLNQITRVIDVLRAEKGSRRGTAVVYHPEDAGRESHDVPCHIAVAYNVRDDGLHASTIMRSCNAMRVLPYDFFLFTLLAEVVATAVGRPLTAYHQFTVSMHVYAEDFGDAARLPAAESVGAVAMPAMPPGDPWKSIAALAEAERTIRHRVPFMRSAEIRSHSGHLADSMDPYWSSFAQILLLHAARRGGVDGASELADLVRSSVFPAFKSLV